MGVFIILLNKAPTAAWKFNSAGPIIRRLMDFRGAIGRQTYIFAEMAQMGHEKQTRNEVDKYSLEKTKTWSLSAAWQARYEFSSPKWKLGKSSDRIIQDFLFLNFSRRLWKISCLTAMKAIITGAKFIWRTTADMGLDSSKIERDMWWTQKINPEDEGRLDMVSRWKLMKTWRAEMVGWQEGNS